MTAFSAAVSLIEGNLFATQEGTFDLIVSTVYSTIATAAFFTPPTFSIAFAIFVCLRNLFRKLISFGTRVAINAPPLTTSGATEAAQAAG